MKTKQEMISRSLYLESEVWNKLDKEAELTERSGNKTVSFILKEYFKTKDKKARAKRKV